MITSRQMTAVSRVCFAIKLRVQIANGCMSAMIKFYDTAEFDPFWQMVTDLDVPVYFHPRSNIPLLSNLEFGHSSFLRGSPQEFAATLSTHVMGLSTNGVFE